MAIMNLNRVTLIGRLGKDPQLNRTQTGNAVANFSMATSYSWKDKQDQWQEQVDWHNVVVWGKQAEAVADQVGKGAVVVVEGRLTTRKYTDKQGIDRYSTEVVADKVMWPKTGGASSGGSRGQGEFSGGGYSGGSNPPEDDIPF